MDLLIFPHSHYCEKGRWALDYKELAYRAVPLLPGFHIRTVKKYAPNSSVPVLLTGQEVVQGSTEIIDFLDKRHPGRDLTPSSHKDQRLCRDLEQWGDENLGIPLRQILYHRLLAYPSFIGRCFTHGMGWGKKFVFMLSYPLVRKKIREAYVRSEGEVAEGSRKFDAALLELDDMLYGKEYLVDGRFTRADLSIASMLSILILPPEHPFPWGDIPDPEIRELREAYSERRFFQWSRKIYRNHREPRPMDEG